MTQTLGRHQLTYKKTSTGRMYTNQSKHHSIEHIEHKVMSGIDLKTAISDTAALIGMSVQTINSWGMNIKMENIPYDNGYHKKSTTTKDVITVSFSELETQLKARLTEIRLEAESIEEELKEVSSFAVQEQLLSEQMSALKAQYNVKISIGA